MSNEKSQIPPTDVDNDPLGADTSDEDAAIQKIVERTRSGRSRDAVKAEIAAVERRLGKSETDDEILSRIDAREIDLVEADIRDLFGKLGMISRTHDPKGVVCGWHVVNGRIAIHREDLPVDCNLETESECHREHRRSILKTIRAAYEAGRAA